MSYTFETECGRCENKALMTGVELPCSKCEHLDEKKTVKSEAVTMEVTQPWTPEALIIAALVRRLGGDVLLTDLELEERGGMIQHDHDFGVQIVTNEKEKTMYQTDDLGPGSKTKVHKFGSIIGLDTTERHIWPNASADKPWPVTAEECRVKAGGNAADDQDGGDNARSVRLVGLDENFDPAEETVTCEGADVGSESVITFSRIFCAYVVDVGVYDNKNLGDITIENKTTNEIMAIIKAGKGQTEMSHYTVPRGHTAYLVSAKVSADGTQDGKIRMWQRQNADNWSGAPFSSPRIVSGLNSVLTAINLTVGAAIPFPEKTDLWWTGQANAATNDMEVAYDLILVKRPI